MAVWRMFVCPGCGYEVRSSGGPDMLMSACTQAIVCKTCTAVMDVVTHSVELGNHPPKRGDPGVAPKCEVDPAHKVVLWGRRHPCPKCGRGMEEDPRGMILAD